MTITALYDLFCGSTGVSTDTRTLLPGQLYVALRGPSFNGNAFAQQALAAGAAYAIVDDPALTGNERYVLVEDTLTTLQELARHHRKQLSTTIIAITGSNGKTTTKELTAAVLSSYYPTFATPGNLNNHIGLPLSVLRITDEHRFAVLELGDNHPGEVALLSSICRPHYGLVTNVGMDHLEGFGSMEANIAAKKELFDFLATHEGTAFLAPELDYLSDMAKQVPYHITYGTTDSVQYRGQLLEASPYLRGSFHHRDENYTVATQLVGSYNLMNVLAAAAIGLQFGVPAPLIVEALTAYRPANNRSQVEERDGYHLILDAYNANPSNVEAALTSFGQLTADSKAVLLGDMLELGSFSPEAHLRMAQQAIACGADRIVLVGPQYRAAATAYGMLHFEHAEAAREWFLTQEWTGYWILVKGSRGIRMETIVR
jgi:UDP-N-acetylmuramoyl-tripeptide--D-alanyl-D-alanine ligase